MELEHEPHMLVPEARDPVAVHAEDVRAAVQDLARTSGGPSPPTICRNVLLPTPEAPTIASISPLPISRSMPSRTVSVTGPLMKASELLYMNKGFYFFSPALSPGFTVSITFSTACPVLVAFSSIFCLTTSASFPTPLIHLPADLSRFPPPRRMNDDREQRDQTPLSEKTVSTYRLSVPWFPPFTQ